MQKILLIDDEQDMLDILRYCLQAQGFEVHTALDGVEGFVRTKEIEPDLIIMDITMPSLDGWALLNLFKLECLATPVIVLSGRNDLKTAVEQEMKTDFFLKPFHTIDVINKVHELVHN